MRPRQLALLLIMLLLFGLGGARISEIVSTNLLAVRLERAIYGSARETDAALLADLQSPGFVTRSPRVAWWGGYTLLARTSSYAAARRIWAMAPAFSAAMLAQNASRADDKTTALEAARAAFELDPAALEVRRAYADALVASEKWPEAARRLVDFLAERPDDAAFTGMRGFVEYKGGGSTSRAEELLLQARALDPKLIRTCLYLADFYKVYGTQDQVEAAALEGLRVSIEAKSLYSYNFEDLLVEVYLRQGKLDKIPPYLDSLMMAFPEDARLNSIAGEYYLRAGIFDRAIRHYLFTVKTIPDPKIFIDLGDAYEGIGDQENALGAYCQALSLDNHHPVASQRLGGSAIACD